MTVTPRRHRRLQPRFYKWAIIPAASMLVLTACSPSSTETTPASEESYPASHIHGMSVETGSDNVLLATHDGLFNVSVSPIEKIGPTIDLMGFTATENGTLYASGHPGPDAGLPNPVGLIRSTDAGKTWQPLSRQGQSDFHALATTEAGVIGYDGELQTSVDGTSWEPVEEQIPVFNLAGTPQDSVALATTEQGLQRSTDHGLTWEPISDAPLLMFATLTKGKAAGITPDGRVYTSDDAGLNWTERGTVPGQAAAIAARAIDASTLRVWVATETGVLVSDDSGRTFSGIETNQAEL